MKISQIQLFSTLGLICALIPLQAQPTDDPVLIDITTLDQLYAIRYDMNGNGAPDTDITTAEATAYRTAFGLTESNNNTCTGGCDGYELMNTLDFNDTDPDMAGNQLSKWAKNCTSSCETGRQADGTTGNTGWESIYYFNDQGTSSDNSDDVENRFASKLYGNEFTISNLYVNRKNEEDIYAGLFGITEVERGIVIKDLHLVDVEVTAKSDDRDAYAGSLVAYSYADITNCSATGDVTCTGGRESYAGGLAGNSNHDVTSCYATVNVTSRGAQETYAGGLCRIEL